MKFTNEMNLPASMVSAITNDTYTMGKADISVTTLIQPPKIRVLKSRHRDEIVEDVADRVWALLGTNTHAIIERINHPDSIQEERLSMEVSGWTISGQADLYEDGIISDFKTTSVWGVINGPKDNYIHQLNCYAEMFRQSGFSVKGLQVIAILRDWSKFGGQRSQSYPKKQVVRVPIPLWGHIETMNYLRDRVRVHQIAECLADDDIPCCTPEERWERPTRFAIVKGKNKRAWRVVDSLEEAEKLKAEIEEGSKDKYRIDERTGESVRCANYCSVNQWCHYWQSTVPF